MSRGSKIIHIPEKQKGRKTKVPKHGIDSGLECALEVFEHTVWSGALEVFERPRRTRGSKKTLYRIYQLLRKRMEFRLGFEENSVQNLPGME